MEEQEEAEEEQKEELEGQLSAHALLALDTLLSVAILLLCSARQCVNLQKLTLVATSQYRWETNHCYRSSFCRMYPKVQHPYILMSSCDYVYHRLLN